MKKIISLVLSVAMFVSLIPSIAMSSLAADPETDVSEMNALSALGIDTSVAPDGFDVTAKNPYGKESVTLNPVSELLVTGLTHQAVPGLETTDPTLFGKTTTIINSVNLSASLYGNDSSANTVSGMLSYSTNTDLDSAHTTKNYTYSSVGSLNGYSLSADNYAATKTAAGNFVGNISKGSGSLDGGKDAQVVMVYAGALASDGGVYLKFGDAKGTYGDNAKTLVSTEQRIGNLASNIVEDFASLPYLMQNYLQVATGDFDGNGVDEIAVYVPQQGSTRIAIYRLKQYAGTDYKNPDDWEIAWNYYLNEKPYVSNMVSLTSGDFNKDGVDDLATTYGFYYGSSKRNGGTAVVMFGSTSAMLQDSTTFPLTYGTSPIVRAAFTYGDITGGGDSLVLGGQLDSDIASGNLYSRFVAVYTYTGNSFTQNMAQNFDLFDKTTHGGVTSYVYSIMSMHGDRFYSSPLCVSNLTTLSRGLSESAQLYFDSLVFTYGDSGLELTSALDTSAQFQAKTNGSNGNGPRDYVEYGADSADFIGLGYDTAATMQYFIPFSKGWGDAFPGGLYWLYSILIDYLRSIYGDYYYPGETYLTVFGNESTASGTQLKFYDHLAKDFSTSFCLPDTDNDTSLLKYTGKHYFRYTDPEVLAVLSSPPAFADLLRDDLSGSYGQSMTSYASSSGSGSGVTANATIKLGTYVSFEQSIEVFGIEVAKVEAEASITFGFTYEFEQTSSLEQEITYSTSVGEDAVAFYSIPLEIYEYSAFTPDGNGGYKEQLMTVNVPKTAAVRVMSLADYETIQADYDELPQISGAILSHTVGDPGSYPTSTSGYPDAIPYSGDYSAVGFGNGAISQAISMTTETSHSFSGSVAVEGKAGAGAGGVTVGVVAGVEAGAGYIMTSTSGNSFSGEMMNMPSEAQPYGYGVSWKVFSYKYSYNDGDTVKSFPVVSYLVTDVSAPPALPTDFEQYSEHTTSDQISLTWSYDKTIAGFQLYRYYEFPDGSGSYELAFIPFDQGTLGANGLYHNDGLYHFEYLDKNLDPYTDYDYQIQAVRAYVPNNSILSKVMTARTKSDVGYPVIQMSGLTDGKLQIYPDSVKSGSTVALTVTNSSDYSQGINYQWQKLVDGVWTDLGGKEANEITFVSAGQADQGEYRCRINVIYNSYYISAYSDPFSTIYSKRTGKKVSFSATANASTKIPSVSITLEPEDPAENAAPTGNVTFTIKGTDYEKAYTSALVTNASRQSTASIDPALATALPDGVYEISASYGGSRVFKSLTEDPITLLVGSDGYQLVLKNEKDKAATSFIYGAATTPLLTFLSKDGSGNTVNTVITDDAAYAVYRGSTVKGHNLSDTELAALLKTLPIGDYRATAEYDDASGSGAVEVAYRDFTIAPREITVSVAEPFSAAKGQVESNMPNLAVTDGTLVNSETLTGTLGLYVKAINTATVEVLLNNSTDPANYSIVGALYKPEVLVSDTPDQAALKKLIYLNHLAAYQNYKITFLPGTYTVTSTQYNVTAECGLVNGNVAGTVAITQPASHDDVNWTTTYSGGTSLYFRATPKAGYEVKSWIITKGTGTPEVAAGKINYFSYNMEDRNLHVLVEFKPVDTTLTTRVNPTGGGAIACSDAYFTSGATVSSGAEMSFTATPATGYHFARWEIVRGGLTTDSTVATLNFTMGAASTTLYAVFERDGYTLSLGSNLRAWYEYTYYDSSLGKSVTTKLYVLSGSEVSGDTPLTVEPAPGFTVADSAIWYGGASELTKTALTQADGVKADNSSYTFTILGDTFVTVATQNEKYDVGVSVTGGTGTVSVQIASGTPATVSSTSTFLDVSGGSPVTLTASPAYGFVFDRWVVGSTEYTGNTLSILALGSDTDITARFKANASYTVAITHGDRGSMTYTLTDANSNIVAKDAPASGSVTVFAGDKMVLTASPKPSFMVDKWTVDGTVYETSAKTYTLDYSTLTASSTVYVEFKAQSYYTVNYSVSGTGGAIASATSDNISFESGYAYVGGGTKVVIAAAPDAHYTVEKWTIDGQTVLNDYGKPYHDNSLTIDALHSTTPVMGIVVFFTPIIERTITMSAPNASVSAVFTPDRSLVGKVYNKDAAVFTVTPDNGYRLTSASVTGNAGGDGLNGFDRIVKNADGSWVCTVYESTADIALTVQSSKLYSLTMPVAPVGGSVILGAAQAIAGESVTLSATPGSNYKFESWALAAADSSITTPVTPVDSKAAPTTFTMPAFDVKVAATFTYIPGEIINGGGGGGLQPVKTKLGPEDIIRSGSTSILTLTDLKDTISDECNLVLIQLNATMDIVITGNGLNITIPKGSLKSGDNVNLMLPDLTGITGDSSYVVVYYDASGNRVIVPWSVVGKNLISFIAKNGGRYEIIQNPVQFNDIAGHWSESAIEFVTSRELFMGTGGNLFSADENMSRAMLVTVLHRLDGLMKCEGTDFNDVPGGQWFSDAVEWAAANGIVGGYGNGDFGTGDNITREQLAVILYRYASYLGIDTTSKGDLSGFSDNSTVSGYALEAMRWASEAGLVNGRPGGILDPSGNATRAEVAAVLMRFVELVVQ